jgi:hypothetical protein
VSLPPQDQSPWFSFADKPDISQDSVRLHTLHNTNVDDSAADINGGEKILLRLRPPWAPDTFYDEDQVVRVMLHEASLP